MKTFVIGDVHGAYRALVQCLERSEINKEEDLLITLGDICDGWNEVKECIDELLTIKNRIDIVGNHDQWFTVFLKMGHHADFWKQGGKGTAESYLRSTNREHLIGVSYMSGGYKTALLPEDVPFSHQRFFRNQHLYYKDDTRNALFVHGGFDRYKSITENKRDNPLQFYWDRDLWEKALCCRGDQKLATVDQFDTIYIGHTSCSKIDRGLPVYRGGVWNLDTGAGWEGCLTIMDVDTHEYWQSDPVPQLYPELVGRR